MIPDIINIKNRRKSLSLSQKEFAEACGVSQSFIAKLESSKIEPSYSLAKKIFLCLDSFEHKSEKKCIDVMTPSVYSVRKSDKIKIVLDKLKKYSVDQLPVMGGKRVVGSISESIIFKELAEGISHESLLKMQVSKVMLEPFPIVNSDMPSSVVIPMLKAVDAILVSRKEEIIGIITKTNII